VRRYIDFKLIEEYPNKYNLTPKSIKKLKILDWDRLKKKTWHNNAMLSGNWWCHLEGSNLKGNYDDEDEFWIGFNEINNKIDCHFTSYGGMCHYSFNEFYKACDIENKYDMHVQVNAIRWLNEMIDDGILGI
jgi:hypothetical protein